MSMPQEVLGQCVVEVMDELSANYNEHTGMIGTVMVAVAVHGPNSSNTIHYRFKNWNGDGVARYIARGLTDEVAYSLEHDRPGVSQ